MSWEKFLKRIDRSWLGSAVSRQLQVLENINPERFYVENIRSFFGFPHTLAFYLCEMAVREGLFRKRVGYMCPLDHKMIVSLRPGEPPPETVDCEVCEIEDRPSTIASEDLEKIEFYALHA